MTNVNDKPLIASEGKWLTDGQIYSKRIFLAPNDSAENYHEITDAEYEEILKQREEQID